ncbi:hypothetical protein HYY75_12520 [bacterium]|nr:hypothetical protein [bacterium]
MSFILFLSTVSSKIVVMSLGSLFYVMGHCFDILRMLFDKKGSFFYLCLLEAIAFVLPDFSLYELRTMVVHEIPFQFSALLLLTAYSLALSSVYLAFGGKLLARRDL